VKTAAVFILAILGLIFLVAATAVAGGMASVSNSGWLLPGGLACWLLAWIVSMLPG
jgi:hypothetical protein